MPSHTLCHLIYCAISRCCGLPSSPLHIVASRPYTLDYHYLSTASPPYTVRSFLCGGPHNVFCLHCALSHYSLQCFVFLHKLFSLHCVLPIISLHCFVSVQCMLPCALPIIPLRLHCFISLLQASIAISYINRAHSSG